jgi:dTDP-glucose pyrophosphorylase
MSSYKVNIRELNSFDDIIKSVDSFGIGFIAVVNDENKLLGIITDGDIRKALLTQKKDVNEIINNNPITLIYTTPKSQIIAFLEQKRRYHMPLVDDNNYLKEVFFLHNFDKHFKPNKVVVMAGGLGTRLGDITKNTPKPMLKVKGKPIIEYIVESFKSQGFNKFIFCINYKKEIIENYFGDGSALNVQIEYVLEEKRLGTAGALSLINLDELSDPCFVVNGDVISTIDYQMVLDYYHNSNSNALMCVKELSHTNPYAEVEFDSNMNLLSLREKPTNNFHINLGVYLVNRDVMKLLPDNAFYDMPDLFLEAKKNNLTVKVHNVNDDWLDIGKPKDYLTLRND